MTLLEKLKECQKLNWKLWEKQNVFLDHDKMHVNFNKTCQSCDKYSNQIESSRYTFGESYLTMLDIPCF